MLSWTDLSQHNSVLEWDTSALSCLNESRDSPPPHQVITKFKRRFDGTACIKVRIPFQYNARSRDSQKCSTAICNRISTQSTSAFFMITSGIIEIHLAGTAYQRSMSATQRNGDLSILDQNHCNAISTPQCNHDPQPFSNKDGDYDRP